MMRHVNGKEDDDNDAIDDDVVADEEGGKSAWPHSKMASAERALAIEFRPISISEKRCTQNRHAAQNSSKTCPRACSAPPPSSVRELKLLCAADASFGLELRDAEEVARGGAENDDDAFESDKIGVVIFQSKSISLSESLFSSSEPNRQPENSNKHSAF